MQRAAIRSSCSEETFFLCSLLSLIAKQFFPEYCVSLFYESSCGHPLLNGYWIYFRRALAAMNCTYIPCIWQILLLNTYCNFKGPLAAIYLSGTVIDSGGHLQWSCIFKGAVFHWNKHFQSSLFSKTLS